MSCVKELSGDMTTSLAQDGKESVLGVGWEGVWVEYTEDLPSQYITCS